MSRTSTDSFFSQHAIAHGRADFEAVATARPFDQLPVLDRHQQTSRRAHRRDGESQNNGEQFLKRPLDGELVAGLNQRAHRGRGTCLRFLQHSE